MARYKTLKPRRRGQKKIRFRPGALHAQLGVAQGKKIPAGMMADARAGKYGPLAQRRANFARHVLTGSLGKAASGRR